MNRHGLRALNQAVREFDRYLAARISLLATLRSVWSVLR